MNSKNRVANANADAFGFFVKEVVWPVKTLTRFAHSEIVFLFPSFTVRKSILVICKRAISCINSKRKTIF